MVAFFGVLMLLALVGFVAFFIKPESEKQRRIRIAKEEETRTQELKRMLLERRVFRTSDAAIGKIVDVIDAWTIIVEFDDTRIRYNYPSCFGKNTPHLRFYNSNEYARFAASVGKSRCQK